ncbi:hypothetical protein [Mycolicibacterium goodii]|uniref:Antitoxin n=1 Tax=Mycolicibacterium goodii TaxID=134601 RepID=A0ABS6HU03_MYCGD|nr:hypothetical protein [Mycolicibacterium goodii]MBU8809110.1 hypothetical protein [Mycolicibacterium goodii]MBU8820363.1 hypothetical protein [Mycolicibacterium goodii]MBU8825693.1 hypothetical protein [Mycolicibacterium goodii]MBU8836465.1 hypothetical protein [Mycolicibacterium goodii]PJK18957.1 hypothetical protein CSX11_28780 [Mycolicibacterium goodii]
MSKPDKPNRHTVNKIFGDALPEIAPDERDTASPEDEAEHDRWLRRNVPPHHE